MSRILQPCYLFSHTHKHYQLETLLVHKTLHHCQISSCWGLAGVPTHLSTNCYPNAPRAILTWVYSIDTNPSALILANALFAVRLCTSKLIRSMQLPLSRSTRNVAFTSNLFFNIRGSLIYIMTSAFLYCSWPVFRSALSPLRASFMCRQSDHRMWASICFLLQEGTKRPKEPRRQTVSARPVLMNQDDNVPEPIVETIDGVRIITCPYPGCRRRVKKMWNYYSHARKLFALTFSFGSPLETGFGLISEVRM